MRSVGFWLGLLSLLLIVGEPLAIAPRLAALLPTLADRGPGVAAFVLARVIVAGVAVAAGLALWNRRPHAIALTRAALVLSAATSLLTLLTPILPSNLAPGMTFPAAALTVAYDGGWLAYLSLSARGRSDFK
jgi:hypothetical protein